LPGPLSFPRRRAAINEAGRPCVARRPPKEGLAKNSLPPHEFVQDVGDHPDGNAKKLGVVAHRLTMRRPTRPPRDPTAFAAAIDSADYSTNTASLHENRIRAPHRLGNLRQHLAHGLVLRLEPGRSLLADVKRNRQREQRSARLRVTECEHDVRPYSHTNPRRAGNPLTRPENASTDVTRAVCSPPSFTWGR